MIIKGNTHDDSRGTVRFVNDFTFEGIRRFYAITHPDTSIIRAWQGHKLETKYFYAAKGCFLINWIKIDNWQQPSKDLKKNAHILSDRQSEVLVIPPGYANGLKALETDSILISFSDMTLEESQHDDYRFPPDYWILEH